MLLHIKKHLLYTHLLLAFKTIESLQCILKQSFNRSSYRRCSIKKGVVKSATKFTGKRCGRDSVLIKLQS